MPPPVGPDVVRQCYFGDAQRVEDAIRAGADVLEIAQPAVPHSRRHMRGQPEPRCGIALHYACMASHVDCVRALLATERYEQLDWPREKSENATPLVILCQVAGCSTNPSQAADTLPCIELLLEAGAALEPATTDEHTNVSAVGDLSAEVLRGRVREDPSLPQGWRVSPSGLTALDFAYLSGRSDIVRALEEAASLRYSVQTHRRFPRPARYVAAHSLRLGYQIGSGALLPVWAGRVLPFLISRTSRGPAPARLPDKATIAKTTVEMLTSDAEVTAVYGAGKLTIPALMTAVAGKLGVTDAMQVRLFVEPTVKEILFSAACDDSGFDEAIVSRLAAFLDAGLVLAADPAPRPEVD